MVRISWPALRLQLPVTDRTALTNLIWAALDDLAPTAVDDESERSGWLTIHFGLEEARARAAVRFRGEMAGLGVSVTEFDIGDDGWAERSQAELKAVSVGRLTVRPPWDCQVREPDTVVIEPSMGFGTGHHATTRLCLAALQRLPLAGLTLADVGTGSGILAIASVLLGASKAVAIDTDVDALECARKNAQLNRVGDRVTFLSSDLRTFAGPATDVVVANLTGSLLRTAARKLVRLVRPEGHLILSGLLATEEADVAEAFQSMAEAAWRDEEDGWVGLLLRRL